MKTCLNPDHKSEQLVCYTNLTPFEVKCLTPNEMTTAFETSIVATMLLAWSYFLSQRKHNEKQGVYQKFDKDKILHFMFEMHATCLS